MTRTGGGCGENYISLIKFFHKEYLEYHVVEQEKNCQFGKELELPGNIFFHENDENPSRCLNDDK